MEDVLEEVTQEKNQESEQQDQIVMLEKQLKDAEEIAKKAQYDYIMLKGEFDSYVRRVE